ncbi:MAG TPA: aminoglycoside phosphotransferase family protein [Kofleriaceae bacterium]|nr:aminoglycoside phosphotransferase family protein [Kofleriaceae bacterium]
MTPDRVAALLAEVGERVDPRALVVERRDWRWFVQLPGDRMLFVPVDEAGAHRLAAERRLLAALAPRLSFAVPRPIGPPEAALDLRTRVRGETGIHLHGSLITHTPDAYADDLARLLAELHGAFARDELVRLAPPMRADVYPLPEAQLRAVVASLPAEIHARVHAALDRYAELAPTDSVLVHNDIGTHNLAFDPDSHRVIGIFDFEEAAHGDRHHDAKYLPSYGPRITARVLELYRDRTGIELDVPRIRLLHFATALSFWVWRESDPVAHDTRSSRDRDQALAWIGLALFAL